MAWEDSPGLAGPSECEAVAPSSGASFKFGKARVVPGGDPPIQGGTEAWLE